MKKEEELKIISGRSNIELARGIASYMGVSLTEIFITEFADNELFVRIEEDIRGRHVFVIQPTSNPGYKNLFELLVIIDTLKRASAGQITAVVPYYGYARQERKTESRVPITAKLVANLLTVAGADRVVSMDLHAAPIQGFFDIPVDHLVSQAIFLDYARKVLKANEDWVCVSPDVGGLERARSFARHFQAGIAVFDKRREKKNAAEVLNLIGEVKGQNCLLFDDMIDTGGTIAQAASRLKENFGAKSVHIMAAHAIFSGEAPQRLRDSAADSVIVTDTIEISPQKRELLGDKLMVLSAAPLFGEAIERIFANRSVSSLFLQPKKV